MTVKKPSPYIPAFLRAAVSGSRPLQLTFSDVADTNILSTSSFIYDAPNAPLKSTQQLNVDWSKFQNHTFFMSAEAKVNLAFDQIINGYPFDGTRTDVEVFFDKLTGFDRWVFDQFPRFRGELAFSGTQAGEINSGTFIIVKDYAGSSFPEISKNRTGESILNPKGTSMSIELQLFIPAQANDVQVVFQKQSTITQGFSLYLTQSSSTSHVDATFSIASGSNSLSSTMTLIKGSFNHICVVLNKETGVQRIEMYRQAELVASSKSAFVINELDIDNSDFLIGSGSSMTFNGLVVRPKQTLSGVIDELRVFHSVRSTEQQALFAQKAIFSTPDLKLYYRFNEPAPPLVPTSTDSVNSIVIDSSGNALHALISNFTGTLRLNAAIDTTNPVIFEKEETTPILFPAYPAVVSLNEELLLSASLYDQANPNLITRLVPQHYLLEGASAEGFETIEGNNTFGGEGIPGQGKMSNVQLMLSLLYIWARFFDEMKLYIDAFSTLKTVDYDTNLSMPNNFLRDLVAQYGFHLPPLFNDSTVEQYIRAENIDQEISTSETSLKSVQNELLRRVLINLPDVLRSKGTQHSIKAFLRAVGIDPENSVRLREFGGPTTRQLSFARENKRDVTTVVQFSSASLATSPFLSASRIEVGFPQPAGTMVQKDRHPPHGISNNVNDGLLTSGSWTVEGIIRYTPTILRTITDTAQSLGRICVVGSTALSSSTGLVANLVAVYSASPTLTLYIRPGNATNSPLLTVNFPTSPETLFGSDQWNFSFGCERNDAIGSRVSSSYFIRVASQTNGEISYFKTTSSYFYEVAGSDTNVLRKLDTIGGTNLSGAFLAVGTGQTVLSGTGTGYLYLNDASTVPNLARTTAFTGSMSNFRFWSKALTEQEWREHVLNYKSLGVHDPLVNYNFEKFRTGSFERVRMDTLAKQIVRRANGTASLGPLGGITFLDFSLNNLHMTGTNFPVNFDCVKGQVVDYTYLSPYFDEASSNEKIRIRSFLNQDLTDATPWAATAPVYEIVKSEEPTDDVRFAVEFSLIDALNRDIVTMFSTFDAIDNALGSPELVFSADYPDLERLRNIYFNRISQRLNFKAFFEFFRWFDCSIGTFIEQLIPRKTNFKGTNFMIESHMLERHKFEYQSSEIYLGESDRARINATLLLQLISGIIRKY